MTRPKPRSDRLPVIVGTESTAVIREIGPTAWVVLVHLYGSPTDGTRSVAASTRTLAAELGLSKDTCSRALRTLRTAGLVSIDTARTELGRFGTVRYRLTAPPRLISTRVDQPSEPTPPEPTPPDPPPSDLTPSTTQTMRESPTPHRYLEPQQLALLLVDERT